MRCGTNKLKKHMCANIKKNLKSKFKQRQTCFIPTLAPMAKIQQALYTSFLQGCAIILLEWLRYKRIVSIVSCH